jgi:UDP:flavonoid glycosyltransferase YjiC (YdhE family)
VRWLLYALGGGLGHLTRSCALARAAHRRGVHCTILSNSAHARFIASQLQSDIDIVPLPAELDRSGVTRAVRHHLNDTTYDALVVDTFARGLAGELHAALPQMMCQKVFVHRDIEPAYVRDSGLERFVEVFDLVLSPGERGPLGGVPSAPWLMFDHDELWSRERARRALTADGDRPVVLVVAAGTSDEIAEISAAAEVLQMRLPEGSVRLAAPAAGLSYWPLLRLMAGVDVVVGGGGYNTVYEARATGRPLLAVARERCYDRQWRRLSSEEQLGDLLEDAPGRIRALLGTHRPLQAYDNGAHAAVEAIIEAA